MGMPFCSFWDDDDDENDEVAEEGGPFGGILHLSSMGV
jgi:hypothetical protein